MSQKLKYILSLLPFYVSSVVASDQVVDPDYWTIEGMRSQEFSVGIFIFMLIGVVVFLAIVFQMIVSRKATEHLKTGEKVMLVCIILGVISAVTFGATQLLHGRLF